MKTILIPLAAGILLAGASDTALAVAPLIKPSNAFQHAAVDIGKRNRYTVTAVGTAPLSYQWRLNGSDLLNQTNQTLVITNAQPTDEGDYSVVVTNLEGAVTSTTARLWVVPPATAFIKGNFTNSTGLRLPYFYLLPGNYDAARAYPLVCACHGTPGDETVITNANYGYPGYLNYPATKTLVSYRQQATNPVILLWPTRRAGDNSWTTGPRGYLQQISDLLGQFLLEFNIDTNRVYVTGASEGLHAAWDLIGMRPGLFAAARFQAGWQGGTPVRSIKDMPIWVWCAANDDAGQLGNTQALVGALRQAGGNPIYTEYTSGGHLDGILMGTSTPAIVEWVLAQRRGVAPKVEPLLLITNPTPEAVFTTAAATLNLAGSAEALGQAVASVSWENTANGKRGAAVGTNTWSAIGIPLVAGKTNLIIVTATTTSWVPSFGGNTTFNDTLTVYCSPIRLALALPGADAILNWTGGMPPYTVECTTDLGQGNWTVYLTNAVPPVEVPLGRTAEFYRVSGR